MYFKIFVLEPPTGEQEPQALTDENLQKVTDCLKSEQEKGQFVNLRVGVYDEKDNLNEMFFVSNKDQNFDLVEILHQKSLNFEKQAQKNKVKSEKEVKSKQKETLLFIVCFIILIVLAVALFMQHQKQVKLSQDLTIVQLEQKADYDKVAQKMQDFGKSKNEIAKMYIEHREFAKALKSDKKALTGVLKEIDTMDGKDQKSVLETLKKANIVSKKESISLDLRLALLNKDIDFLKKNIKSVDSQALSDRIVKLFIDEKEYASANEQLKFFANKALDKQAKQAEHDDKKQALTNKVNELKKAISDTQKQLDGKNKQLSDLHKQLDDLNKNDKSPDKGKHVDDKNKEIDNANKDKNKISDILKDQQGKEKEAQKALDSFT